MKSCRYCGSKMMDDEVICPKCGRSIYDNEYVINIYAFIAIIATFFIPLLGIVFGCIGLNQSDELGGSGRKLSIAAIIISITIYIVCIIWLIISFVFRR